MHQRTERGDCDSLLLDEGPLATVGKLFPVLLNHLEDELPHLGVLGEHLEKLVVIDGLDG